MAAGRWLREPAEAVRRYVRSALLSGGVAAFNVASSERSEWQVMQCVPAGPARTDMPTSSWWVYLGQMDVRWQCSVQSDAERLRR